MTPALGLTPGEGGLAASATILGHLLGALATVRARMPGGTPPLSSRLPCAERGDHRDDGSHDRDGRIRGAAYRGRRGERTCARARAACRVRAPGTLVDAVRGRQGVRLPDRSPTPGLMASMHGGSKEHHPIARTAASTARSMRSRTRHHGRPPRPVPIEGRAPKYTRRLRAPAGRRGAGTEPSSPKSYSPTASETPKRRAIAMRSRTLAAPVERSLPRSRR